MNKSHWTSLYDWLHDRTFYCERASKNVARQIFSYQTRQTRDFQAANFWNARSGTYRRKALYILKMFMSTLVQYSTQAGDPINTHHVSAVSDSYIYEKYTIYSTRRSHENVLPISDPSGECTLIVKKNRTSFVIWPQYRTRSSISNFESLKNTDRRFWIQEAQQHLAIFLQ